MAIVNSFLNIKDIDEENIYKWFVRINSSELSKIDIPCYYPKINRYYLDVHYISLKPTISDYNNFRNQLGKFKNAKLVQDKFNTLILMLLTHSIINNNKELFYQINTFLAIKFYSSLIHIYFPKFCSSMLWNEAISRISHRNLLKTKKTISNFVKYIADSVAEKYISKLFTKANYFSFKKSINEYILFEYFIVLRHRLAQTIKAFAKIYYKIQKEVKGIRKAKDEEVPIEERLIDRAISLIADMCNTGDIYEKALQISCRRTAIKEEIAKNIISEILVPENINKIKLILYIYTKKAGDDILCKEKGIIYYSSLIEKNIKITAGEYNVNNILKDLYINTHSYNLYKIQQNKVLKLIFLYILYNIFFKICQ